MLPTGHFKEQFDVALNTAVRAPAGGERGGILAALRASPLVGAEIDIDREDTPTRDVDL